MAIQGRQDARQWVTKFFVAYSQDSAHFAEYKENSNRKVCISIYQYIRLNMLGHRVVQFS